jgi:hypothetical protein
MRRSLPRRTFLRGALAGGAAVTIGTPLLDAMLNENGTALAGGGEIPKRFAVWFWGNGSDPDRWAPAVTGPDWTPTEMLAGIAGVKDYINVVSGMTLPTHFHLGDGAARNPHVEGAIAMLAGGNPVIHPSYAGQQNDWDFLTVPGPSVDQQIANAIGTTTAFRSITAAVTGPHTSDSGSSTHPGTAISYISHRAPYNFNPPIMDPGMFFDHVFAGGVPMPGTPMDDPVRQARASILDAILEDAADLDRRLGANDRLRLQSHLDGIRELERRIRGVTPMMMSSSCVLPARAGSPESLRERARLHAEIIAMAFACDLTRVATVEFSSPASHVSYPDVFPGDLLVAGMPTSFHEYEHQMGRDDTVRVGLRYFIEVFGEFVAALRNIPEVDGNVLDNSCVLGTSEVSAGEGHGFTNYPLLVAGRAGGALRYPGVHVIESGSNALRVPFTCMKAMGLPDASWGADQFLATDTVGGIEAV